MVLYNSPLAVAALLVGLLFAILGLVRLARAFRAPTLPEPEEAASDKPRDSTGLSPTLREVLRLGARDMILAVIGVVLLMAALIAAVAYELSR